jgi:hypothetical protein
MNHGTHGIYNFRGEYGISKTKIKRDFTNFRVFRIFSG